ncbi:two-component system histidine kinase PnpS [Thermoflavimicrobium dichotomicum]|uniref:histidine kinase n=1 Tax=Thermoflavimicrobium dichotomicum TaxID=46223 RepID=A0A1I3LBQ6_9BACL|nr:ATP-binding protein [Thermoflavimicrobium dichotomicum]SFI82184.1 two-component system, OmpR family, phosphate regulon sensor histidine kinase PhoR [Thermoflavimicrobium dichotomicum]
MRSLRSKIISMCWLLIGCSVVGTGIYVAILLKSSYIDSLTNRLVKEAQLIAKLIPWEEYEKNLNQFQVQSELYKKSLDARVTLIDAQGRVVGESGDDEVPKGKKGNLQKVSEVSDALKKKGKTLVERRDDDIYVAQPIIRDGQVLGVVRLAIDLDDVNQSMKEVWISLIGGLAISLVLAGFASSRIAKSVSRPLEEMTQVAVDIAKKGWHHRVRPEGSAEVVRLGQAINRMAYSLQRQMEKVRKNKRRLLSVIESMESGLLMIDAEGKINLANRAFEIMFGLPAADLIGSSYKDLSSTYDLSSFISEVAEKGIKLRRQLHLYYPEERILEASFTPMWMETSGCGVVAVFHDLTAIRRLEQLRKDFVANVSHELKTPITSIRGFAETLLDGAHQDPAVCREFLEIILDESIRLQRLISDLLDLSRIESKKLHLNKKWVSVQSLIQSVIKTMEDQIREKEMTLDLNIPEDFQIEVDPDRFRQIFINLLSNAITYTSPGGKVMVAAWNKQDHWVLKVADTGIGIPPEDLPRIFERFYRVDKARARASGGTGLGLAIVKHLVEVHDGKIHVESEVGKGTTFTLTFERKQPETEEK